MPTNKKWREFHKKHTQTQLKHPQTFTKNAAVPIFGCCRLMQHLSENKLNCNELQYILSPLQLMPQMAAKQGYCHTFCTHFAPWYTKEQTQGMAAWQDFQKKKKSPGEQTRVWKAYPHLFSDNNNRFQQLPNHPSTLPIDKHTMFFITKSNAFMINLE